MDYLGLAASLKDGHQQSRVLVTTSSLSIGWLTPLPPPPQLRMLVHMPWLWPYLFPWMSNI